MRANSAKDAQIVKKAARTREEVEKYFPGFMAFTDCTEQHMPRPENKRRRKMYYSCKRKRHTVKIRLMANNKGITIHKTGHRKGKRHDYDRCKKNHPVTPYHVANVFDLGYLDVEKDYPGQLSSLPYKNKRVVCRRKGMQQKPFQKENGDRAYYLQNEKVQDSCIYIQKQIEKVQQGIRYSIGPCKLQNSEQSPIETDTKFKGIE